MRVAHNLVSQFTSRQLNITTTKKRKTTEKLSSGYRINRSADDAAGLQISEKMRSQVRGLNQASENIQDGISLCQVADGALDETHSILQRMRELSIQAANDTNQKTDRDAIQAEINELTKEVDRIANGTAFNEEIYPLLNKEYQISQRPETPPPGSLNPDPGTPGIPPLSDSDYPGSSLQIVNAGTINNYASFTDSDGKTHYRLGSGTFKIEGLTNCVFDVSGNTCIEDTSLKNVTIDCSAGTSLSVKNVKVDNSENTYDTGTETGAPGKGIGAAVRFHGSGNTLNAFGDNEFNGGRDNYTVFTDSVNNVPYYITCSGINVGNGAELTINGTDTSNLAAHGCDPSEFGRYIYARYGYEALVMQSVGIGSNFHEDGGKITINSGHITAYSTISENAHWGNGCIGGGKNTVIIINGGMIDAYGGNFGIGGGDTHGDGDSAYAPDRDKAEVTIDGGIVNVTAGSVGIGCYGIRTNGALNINGGKVNVTAIRGQGVALGGTRYGFGFAGIINITGGTVVATSTGDTGAAIHTGRNEKSGIINITGGTVVATAHENTIAIEESQGSVYIDGVKTDASGTNDGNGHKVYTYQNPSGGDSGSSGTGSGGTGGTGSLNQGIWIQIGANPMQGMFLNLVDATAKELGITDPPLDMTSYDSACTSMTRLDNAINKVSSYRSYFGAQQNRLESGKAVDDNIAENTQAAESRIRDTDMAEEMVNYSKHSILEQAGTSMLAQANQIMQGVSSLLQ